MKKNTFYSHGKLLLTGEYVVLDGAVALAIPTKFGQSLTVEPTNTTKICWKSFDHNRNIWFETEFDINQLNTEGFAKNSDPITQRLHLIFKCVHLLNTNLFKGPHGYTFTSQLEFPRDWGLGSSSTLINNIAQWAHVDAYKLLELSFGGSGYDIACAQHDSAIMYQLDKCNSGNNARNIDKVSFNPDFAEHLYFVYLNKKQNSREAIAHYQKSKSDNSSLISAISDITSQISNCTNLDVFCRLIDQHEMLISRALKLDSIKKVLFPDFKGSIKSLGAWGGDFILVASHDHPEFYFKTKGYTTILSFSEMVL